MAVEPLLKTMQALRDPQSGCPWDLEQTYQTIVPYTIEEVYEVADAIERNDFDDLKQELGDLLFQVVFYCQLAEEDGHFGFSDVVGAVNDKLVERHPHVFANTQYATEAEFLRAWEDKKHQERIAKGSSDDPSFMDDIPLSLPALKRAQKMQKRAARQGFDWPNIKGVWQKIDEEVLEVKNELNAEQVNAEQLTDEIGDLLFAVVNLSRFNKVDAEAALAAASKKFEQRFRFMEQKLKSQDRSMKDQSLEQLDQLWEQAKLALKK